MAVATDSLIEVVYNCTAMGSNMLSVYQYECGAVIPGISLVQILEAYWNNVKANYRACIPTQVGSFFMTLRGRELNNPAGDFAEFDIPAVERAGTRVAGSPTDLFPSFVAVGVRLVVGTRATRPGQKRLGPVQETDAANGAILGAYGTPLNTLFGMMTTLMTLGSPAATVQLKPIICRKDSAGNVTAHQYPTGFLINPNLTSQNTRKVGRGI
jgi:hypothetical protein